MIMMMNCMIILALQQLFVLFETDLTVREAKENLVNVVQVERPPSSHFHA